MAINLDSNFINQHNQLISQASNIGSSILIDSQRQWMLPAGFIFTPSSPEPVGFYYSREGINTTYQQIFLYGGSTGDAMACRIQSDYLSAQERAFRLRHMTSIRCQIHAATRRLGHAAQGGVLQRVITYAQNCIDAGR
jgi:hypothetical protein